MARTQTMVQLTEELIAELDKEAALSKVSRSALIRQAIGEMLADRRTTTDLRRYIEGYERLPQNTPDEWGDPATSADHAGHELAQRLDVEEKEAGKEW